MHRLFVFSPSSFCMETVFTESAGRADLEAKILVLLVRPRKQRLPLLWLSRISLLNEQTGIPACPLLSSSPLPTSQSVVRAAVHKFTPKDKNFGTSQVGMDSQGSLNPNLDSTQASTLTSPQEFSQNSSCISEIKEANRLFCSDNIFYCS